MGMTLDSPSGEAYVDRMPLAYFREARRAYGAAEARAGGPIDRTYAIAGRTIRLRFAGPALLPYLTPALEHLAAGSPAETDFTVFIWDSASTQVSLPEVRLSTRDPAARSTGGASGPRRMRTSFQRMAGSEGELGAVSLFDTEEKLAVHWVPSPDAVTPWDRAAPLRDVLHWILSLHGVRVVHAAGVGTGKGGVLLVGKGGSGKSTTALTCLQHGMRYVGDDYTAVEAQPDPRVWSLYSSAKLNPDSLVRLPHLSAAVSNPERPDDEKALIFLRDRYGDTLPASLPVDAIIVPRVTGNPETHLLPASRAESLAALAPTSIFLLPDADQSGFGVIAGLVRRVPAFRLEIGRESANIPHLITDLLDR